MHPHAHSYILPCKLQLGMQPRHWISTKKACAAAAEERVIYLWPSYKKNVYLPWSFCITLAMSKCFREAMLFCCSANNKVGYWCAEDPSQLSWTGHPLCPSSSALSFYFHCRNKLNWISGCMQGQAGFTVQWEYFIQSLPAKTEMRVSELRPHLSHKFPSLFSLSILKRFICVLELLALHNQCLTQL